jgi:hypothetical protein
MRGGCGRGSYSDGTGRERFTARNEYVHERISLPGSAALNVRTGLKTLQREAASAC